MRTTRLSIYAKDKYAGDDAADSDCDSGADRGSDDGVDDSCSNSEDMNASVLLDTKDLIQILQSPGQGGDGGDHEDQEGDVEDYSEDEGRDLVMDLDARFKSADIKRKFGEVVIVEPIVRDKNSNVPIPEATGAISISNGSGGIDKNVDGAEVCPAAEDTRRDPSHWLHFILQHDTHKGATVASSPRHIKTVLRVRPLGVGTGELSLTVKNSSTVMTTNLVAKSRRGGSSGSRLYTFDKVMDESTPQQRIFEQTAEPLVAGLFESPARSGTVVAYGATNAGKTHTIMGARGDDGILLRSLTGVYRRVQDMLCGGGGDDKVGLPRLRVSLRVVEVYKDKAYDLLRETQDRGQALSFKQTAGGDEIVGLSEHYPEDLISALEVVKQARSRIPVAATALNATSSRGHTVWMIELHQYSKGKGDGRATFGGRPASRRGAAQRPMLWIVDLAGSERINRSMSHMNEAMHINMDTSTLFTCFKQVEAGSQHVSWRGRIITRLLKSMLVRVADGGNFGNRAGWRGGGGGGNGTTSFSSSLRWRCVMIINVNPAATEYSETEKVLTNALISSRARPVEEHALIGAVESVVYGMDGRIIKRHKSIHHATGANSSALSTSAVVKHVGGRRVSARSRAGSSTICVPARASQDEQAIVIEEQAREIARLEGEASKMQEDLDMMQEVAWNEAQHEIQQELFPQIADLEEQLRQEKDATRKLRVLLYKQRPIEPASRVAAAAQSARKQAAEQVETFCDQQAENIREAEDEICREQEQISRAEAALAVASAERDAEAARAATLVAEQTALRRELDESKAKASHFQEERAKLEEVLIAKTARAEEMEIENTGLKNQLHTLRMENSRFQEMLTFAEAEVSTVQMNISTTSCLSGFGDAPPRLSSASGPAHVRSSRTTSGSGLGGKTRSKDDSGDDSSDAQQDRVTRPSTSEKREEKEVGEALGPCCNPPVIDDFDNLGDKCKDRRGSQGLISDYRINVVVDDNSSCEDSTLAAEHGPKKDKAQDETIKRSLPQASPCSASGGESRDKSEMEGADPDQELTASEPLPGAQKPPPKVEEPSGRALPRTRPVRTTRSMLRKPLGSLQAARVDRNRVGRGTTAPMGSRGKITEEGNSKSKETESKDAGNDDDHAEIKEEGSPRTKRRREKKEKAEREKQMKIEGAARSTKDARALRDARNGVMLSKPKKTVLALSRRQGDIVDKAKEIVRARRSGRRKG